VRKVLRKKVAILESRLRKKLREEREQPETSFQEHLSQLESKYRIKNRPLLWKCGVVMSFVIILFFLQGLPSVDISLGWIAILGAVSLLILADFEDLDSIVSRIEWSTLLFFAALFVVMEALAELKLLWYIGQLTQEAINSFHEDYRLLAAVVIILWVSALASSFIDNIPFATVMIKILEDMSRSPGGGPDIPLYPLVYALAFGACLGGNGTLIGASANVVCAGVAEQKGYKISFLDFFKIGFPVMLVTVSVANVYLVICHVVAGWQ
jgi:Na+/H+ antiporter NhaD/arsenite permease-like protein